MSSIKKYMKVGIIFHVIYNNIMEEEENLIKKLTKIATDDYFDSIEIPEIKNESMLKKIKDICEISKLDIFYGAQSILLKENLNLNDLDSEKRELAISRMKEAIDEAYKVGAKGFFFLAGHYSNETKDKQLSYLIESTKEICRYAKDRGDMSILCEIFDYDIDKKSLIGPTKLAKKYAEEVRKEFDNFGLLVDCSHIPMLYESFEEAILPIKDYIKHAHMGNTVIQEFEIGYGDNHPRFGFPNSKNDIEELAKYLQVLKDIGYLNEENLHTVSFEVKPIVGEDSELVIANAKRTLNHAWRLIK